MAFGISIELVFRQTTGYIYIYILCLALHIHPECTSQLLAKDKKAMGDITQGSLGNVKMQILILDC